MPEQYNTLKQNICQPESVKDEKRRLFSENQLKIRIQTDDLLKEQKGDQAISSVKSFTLLHLFQRHRQKTHRLLR